MKLSFSLGILAFACVAFSQAVASHASSNKNYDEAVALAKKGDNANAIVALKKSIEASPDFLPAHDMYIKLVEDLIIKRDANFEKTEKEAEDRLGEQYGEWAKEHPNSAGVQYGMGKMYYDSEDPRAKPYLVKAVELDPKMALAYEMLYIDAERWGDENAARDYLRKASEADPSNPDYAFSYASSFVDIDFKKFAQLTLDAVNRYPHTENAAGGLVWLAMKSQADEDKIKYLQMGREEVSPSNFWNQRCADLMYDVYIRTAPDKAVALAKEVEGSVSGEGVATWKAYQAFAENIVQVNQLLEEKNYTQAKQVLDGAKIGRRWDANNFDHLHLNFDLLRAKVYSESGDNKAAYDLLLGHYAKTPQDVVRFPLLAYGSNLGKSESQVDSDVWAFRYQAAKPAPEFDFEMYMQKGKRSLKDCRGKVVLLTFWFPGCGPCRGEFPHFENVIKKFRGQPVDFVGINVVPSQDDYVKPFMRGTRYSFTPLKANNDTIKDYNVRYEPTNFLIDQTGRIMYTDFMIEFPDAERDLQLMIQSLLDHK